MPCYRICQFAKKSDYNGMRNLRAWWEIWDLRILILYILIAQLCLHFFGRRRRKNKSVLMMIGSVWLLYLFSELLATIALGKLSKIKVEDHTKDDSNKQMGEQSLRVMWAPLILFYLGGPDTFTVLRAEENQLWMRHLIGLLTQGLRTAYALIITWNKHGLSLLALLVFVPGIIKYGERVWVIRSRSNDYKGFVELDLTTIDKVSASRPNASLVLLSYSWFQTLLPYNTSCNCDASKMRMFVARFRYSVRTGRLDAFKLIEIELGLMYDLLFSKVGTIFTVWGSILRFLSFSLIVSVLVIYITCDKPRGHFEGDHIITIILLAGAIFLEIAGIIVQLVSDWAMVWACKNIGSKWGTSVLFLHEFLISKTKRWSGEMGQFNLWEFFKNYKPTVCHKTLDWLFGREKMLKRFSLQQSLDQQLKDMIIRHLLEKTEKPAAVDTLQASTDTVTDVNTSLASTQKMANVDTVPTSTEKVANVQELLTSEAKTGEWTLLRYDCGQQFNWSIELEFGQNIVIWHVATEVCYELDRPNFFGRDEVKLKVVKRLSDYMMYLLVACPFRFPFCKKYDNIIQDYADMNKLFHGGVVLSELEGFENDNTTNINLVNKAQRLVLEMKENPKRWDIMGSTWVEMLCDAATKCPVKNHIEELRHGGEFLTHVWLLLFHFGTAKKIERSDSSLKDEKESGLKGIAGTLEEIKGNEFDKGEYKGGIQATTEELQQNTAGGWASTLF